MHSRLAVIVNERQPLWKHEWVRRLHVESRHAAPVELASMVALMDETFTQFCSLLETRPGHRWLNEHRPSFGRLCKYGRCGLSSLLAYFASGQLALQVVLDDTPLVPANQCAMLTAHWHFLAQREIQSLCGSCCHVCAPAFTVSRETREGIELGSER